MCGVCAGLIGIAMAWLLEGFELLFYGVAAGSLPERVAQAPAWRRVAAPAAAGALAGGAWWWQRARGGVIGVEKVVREAATGGRLPQMGLVRPVGDAVVQVLTVGGGNSVGREGAPRLAAGAVAARVAAFLGLPAGTAGLLVAAAAGGGLAAMYNAPLGGAAYAVELVMVAGTRRRGLAIALPVSAIATVVTWVHNHARAAVPMPPAPASGATLAACLLVALAATSVGWAARRLWSWCRRHRLPDDWHLPLGIGAAGAVTGVVSLWLTIVPGNGRDALEAAVHAPGLLPNLATGPLAGGQEVTSLLVPAATLAGVLLLKPLLTGLTLGAGATGGLLAPSFSIGACTGALTALALGWAGLPVSVPALALVGGAVTLAVTQRAPVFAAVFVWEIVHGPVWALPVVLVAAWVAVRATGGRGGNLTG